jgi:hypothetical protein
VKFTLHFDGDLPSTGNGSKKTRRKWEIRQHFRPQLEELWRINAALQEVAANPLVGRPVAETSIDLCAPIEIAGRRFLPLVRDTFALTCSLDILFLRREAPGKVYQGGDLDNRIKTLLDALAVPQNADHVINDGSSEDPIHCLLEDDRLVTGLNVRTERLLGSPTNAAGDVRLIINVDVRVSDARIYNQSFLGD